MDRNARTRRKVAYRKRNQNRFSMVLVTMVVLIVTVTVAIRYAQMNSRLKELEQQKQELELQIDAANKKAEEIEEFDKYTNTKAYYEEIATEKLGLVYEGEIVFQEER